MPKVIDVNVYNKRAFRYFSKKQIQAWFIKNYPKYKTYILSEQGVKPLNDIESIGKAFKKIGQKSGLDSDKLMERLKIHMMENLKKKNLEEAKKRGTIKEENIKKAEEKISEDVKTPEKIKLSSFTPYKPYNDRIDNMKREMGETFIDYVVGETSEEAQEKRGKPESSFYQYLYDATDVSMEPDDIREGLNSVAYINSKTKARLNSHRGQWDFKPDVKVDVFRVKELQIIMRLIKDLNMIKKVNYKNKTEYIDVLVDTMSKADNKRLAYTYIKSISRKY